MYELTHNEIAAVKALPLSGTTEAAAKELRVLHAEREECNPAIARVLAKAVNLDTEAAVKQLVPLRVKQEVITAKLNAKREAVMAGIVADAAAWQASAEAEVEAMRLARIDTRARFEEKTRAAFCTKDSERLLKGQNHEQSAECREAFTRYQQAMDAAAQAGAARKCLDRQFMVDRVAAGLALPTGRPNVLEPAWHWRNAALVVPELVD